MKRYLFCVDCYKHFLFEEHEQAFFQQRNWKAPIRCKDCRKGRRKDREELSKLPCPGIKSLMRRDVAYRHRHTRVPYPPFITGGFR